MSSDKGSKPSEKQRVLQGNPPKEKEGKCQRETHSYLIFCCSLFFFQELSGTPNPQYFLKSITGTNGRCTAVQIGGVLQYKLEVYCGVSLSSRLRTSKPARCSVTNGGAYCGTNWRCTASTFQESCAGWGFLNSAQRNVRGKTHSNLFVIPCFFSLRGSPCFSRA